MGHANIICIKWGPLFGPEYVNRLYSGVRRNIEAKVRFFCMTENTDGLHPDIEVLSLPEEPFAGPIARALVSWAQTAGPKDTTTLSSAIVDAIPAKVLRKRRKHPATQTFQALRIAVNDELGALQKLLEDGPRQLAPGGRFLVISFHSLEDRMVKRAFRQLSGGAAGQSPRRGLPPPTAVIPDFELLTKKAVTASPEECGRNPRARSARLRGIRRVRGAAA